jgi:predicted nucleotidyltransferase
MTGNVPPLVSRTLDEFIAAARASLGDRLKSVVLFGSGAEGKLRPTSDVNLILVLSSFDQASVDGLRETLRVAQAAIHLTTMFLLENEVATATEAFAVKFADIGRRRKVLFGPDPFAHVSIPRHAEIARLRQVLLNLVLRLRSTYLARSLREEQLALAIADAAGPLRASAAAILELRGQPAASPKAALETVARELDLPDIAASLAHVSEARENGALAPGVAAPTVFALMELGSRMRRAVEAL